MHIKGLSELPPAQVAELDEQAHSLKAAVARAGLNDLFGVLHQATLPLCSRAEQLFRPPAGSHAPELTTAGGDFTEEERRALSFAVLLSQSMRRVIGDGPHAENDWREAVFYIHGLQHMIMSQVAARRNPDEFRTLGNVGVWQREQGCGVSIGKDSVDGRSAR